MSSRLKVPESVLNRLLSSRQPGALKQPMSETEVNEVIDAVGFDFVSQPLTEQQFLLLPPPDADLTNAHLREAVVRLTEFRAKTLSTAPEDFANFETLSMVMVDPDFNGDVFSLGSVHWGEALVKAEQKRLAERGLFGEQLPPLLQRQLHERASLVERRRALPLERLPEHPFGVLVREHPLGERA